MGIRSKLMLLSVLALAAAMALWGWVQLKELEALLYRQQERSLAGVADTVSTYYQHFPTEEGLEALDKAVAEQLGEDSGLARIDLISVSNGVLEYLSGAGRAAFEWSLDLISPFLAGVRKGVFSVQIDGVSAIGIVHPIAHGETGIDPRAKVCVCVMAYTRSNDEVVSNARAFLFYSSAAFLLLLLIVINVSYGWLIDAPLRGIIKVIDKFQAGDFGGRIEIKRRDELGRLAGHFNAMADEIQRMMANNEELSKRQEERIKDTTRRLGELQNRIAGLQRFSAMGLLAANLAHDLGTPLHSIAGMAALILERQGLTPEDNRKLKLIVEQAERLSEIIANVRRATRMPELRPDPTSAAQLFDETVPLLEPLLRNSSVDLKTHVGESCPLLLVDRHRIQTAILNLVQNSLDAMEEDGEISVTAFPSEERGFVVITVKDSGKGIPSDILDRVCEPFFSTHRDAALRGLGLAIVQEIVKVHGGRMEIKSRTGYGTEVRLYLPSVGGAATLPTRSP